MQPLRIALCITDLDPGGAERAMVELALRIDRERFCAELFVLSRPPRQTELVDRLSDAGIPVHFLGAGSAWSAVATVRLLADGLRRWRPHVVQTFLFHANIVGRIAARRAGVAAVASGIRVAQASPRWRLWLDRLTDPLVDRHVCVSRSVARFAETAGRLPAGKLAVIANGVDAAKFDFAPPADVARLGVEAGRQAMVCLGRLDRQKGCDWLIEAAPAIFRRLPKTDLLLVGDGPLQEPLRRRAAELGIAARVLFAGWQADVPGLLAACRLLVLPSRWEGMPNVVLEAMASRRPVVATEAEGVAELLGPHADPQIVRFGDTGGLVERLAAILEDPALASELGRANRQRAVEVFSLERAAIAYHDLWLSMVERRPAN